MENEILNHLKKVLHPDAIILHGSRARGKERRHSDWDFVMLYNKPTDVKGGRMSYQNQNIEYSVTTLPVLDIFETFSAKLHGAKVLYQRNKEGTDLLQQASDYYAQGVYWSPEKIADHTLWIEARINGMRDSIENPIVFNKYFADFYSRVFNYWYWITQHQHSQPIYIAIDDIATKDPIYYERVTQLVDGNTSLAKKTALAGEIAELLFK